MRNADLHKLGLSKTENLRDYQLEGVTWLKDCYDANHGGLLCDEMGLGKTCQAICFLLTLQGDLASNRLSSLILCPLTVLDNWKQELERFAPGLTTTVYRGDQDERSKIRKYIRKNLPQVVLTTYELCLKDSIFFEKRQFDAIVVDEGHRLKNSESLLYKCMETYNNKCSILLTGTPVQNNLSEMYSLLSFVAPDAFILDEKSEFEERFKSIRTDSNAAADLQDLMKPYILRRTKAQVALDIPEKSEITIYHPLSDLQKKYYKAILMKDADVFDNENSVSRTRLLNLLQQLRKCVNHPYLFDGVEPEPFQLGEHLVEASTKLVTLDRILDHVKSTGHKVLIFSQMTRALDILQDYLHYRGYTYERLDGSVRGEERFTAIHNFNSTSDTFVFLLSSRAGGQGLNLTSADTVIFYDHDFNPQVDLQAAARAHRIGQTRPVKIIRLVAKATVEEVILSRAQAKLRLTQSVMSDRSDPGDNDLSTQSFKDLQKILKSGLSSLLSPQDDDSDFNIEEIIGKTVDNEWVVESEDKTSGEGSSQPSESQKPDTIYQFEGKDYSKDVSIVSKDDESALKLLLDEVKSSVTGGETSRTSRHAVGHSALSSLTLPDVRTRKPLTAEQLEVRRKQREKTLERKKAEAEAREKKKQERKMAKWKEAGYTSTCIQLCSDVEDTEADVESESDTEYMHFVSGDVTKPNQANCIIIQCVDNSGQWGSGGVFSALSSKTKIPEQQYELAKDMRDLQEGDVHVVSCGSVADYDDYQVALLVAQGPDLKVKSSTLTTCLKKLAQVCKSIPGLSVHLPRLGYNTPGFNWYSVERQLRKYLSNKRIHTYIYYYKRKQRRQSDSRSPSPKIARVDSPQPLNSSTINTDSVIVNKTDGPLEDIFNDYNFVIDVSVPADERRRLKRYIIAYNGNVIPCETDDTAFVVTIEAVDTCKAVPIKPEFIFDSICYSKMIEHSQYIVD